MLECDGRTAMGRRSGVAETEQAVARLTLDELNADIQRCLNGAINGGTSQGRKALFKRLVWLEKMREKLHGITSPRRVFRSM
jgi:hypothetical protein